MSEIENAIQAAKAAEVPHHSGGTALNLPPPPPSSSDAQSSYSQDVLPVKPPSSISDGVSTYSQDQEQRSLSQQVHTSGRPSPQMQQPAAVFPSSSASSKSDLVQQPQPVEAPPATVVESIPPPLPAGAESPMRQDSHSHSRTASYESRDISTPLQSPSLFSESSRRNPDSSSVQTPTSPALSPTSQLQAQSAAAAPQNKRVSRRQSSYTAREPSIKLSVRPPSMASKPGTAATSTMSRDHELRQKARAGPPQCASWADVVQKKTAGQRAMAYAHKINALGRESSGLALWIEMQRHQQDRSKFSNVGRWQKFDADVDLTLQMPWHSHHPSQGAGPVKTAPVASLWAQAEAGIPPATEQVR